MKIESSTPLEQFQPNFSIIKKSSIKNYFYNNSNEIKTKRKTSKNTSSSTIKISHKNNSRITNHRFRISTINLIPQLKLFDRPTSHVNSFNNQPSVKSRMVVITPQTEVTDGGCGSSRQYAPLPLLLVRPRFPQHPPAYDWMERVKLNACSRTLPNGFTWNYLRGILNER